VKIFRVRLEKGMSLGVEDLKKLESRFKNEYIDKVMADDRKIMT
jgi:hypothetical protein